MTMNYSMKKLFEDNFDVDDREPIATFGIPNIDGDFSLFAPKIGPWLQLVLFDLIQVTIQISFALFIYEAIVKRRGSIASYMIGWGFVIPASLYLPFYLMDILDLRNKAMCLCSSILMTVISFRCIEAMYDTSPEFVELSTTNYCSYYTSMAPFVWSPESKKIQRITGVQLMRWSMERLTNFIAFSIVLSVLIHFEYKTCEDSVSLTSFNFGPDLLSTGHLCNSYLMTLLFYFGLNNLFGLGAAKVVLSGFDAKPVFDSPLTKSKTPTEFWTKRWNHMVHLVLKTGVFQPTNKCVGNQRVAVFFTFVVSGLYHEYCWAAMFYNQKYLYDANGICVNKDCYELKFGRVTAFFAYVGLVMMLERPLKNLSIVKWLSSRLPTIVIAQFLVCLHVPFVKWYGGDWIEGECSVQYSVFLPPN